MGGDFFIWCAGSDTKILAKCEQNIRNKHIGIGTLVLIPAVLGFISMTYALSTIDIIHQKPIAYLLGGLVWGLIVFAFDRFIVSTHKKQAKHLDEFKNITFYLRLLFAFILGIVVSHPFVLLYFDGSIKERIIVERDLAIKQEEVKYKQAYDSLTLNLNSLIKTRRCNEQLLTAEQSGKKLDLPCGSSSGIPNISGSFPRTKEIKLIITNLSVEITKEEKRIKQASQELADLKKTLQQNIKNNTSFDYLKRELILEKLKAENKIVGLTQFFLMMAFILVDILPLIFKTFSSFSIYDKVQSDDVNLLREVDISSRRSKLQGNYDDLNQ